MKLVSYESVSDRGIQQRIGFMYLDHVVDLHLAAEFFHANSLSGGNQESREAPSFPHSPWINLNTSGNSFRVVLSASFA